MTSAGGNFMELSHGENKLKYDPLILKIFADFSLKVANFLPSLVYLVFQKTIKLCTTTFYNFFGKLKILLHFGFPL